MTLTILLSAEGRRDVGDLADPPYGRPAAEEGFFQPLIRRALADHLSEPPTFRGVPPSSFGPDPPRTVTAALAKRAHQAMTVATSYGCDIVVLHVDADAPATKRKPPAKHADRTETLRHGVAAAGGDAPPAVPAVPIATTEAWALADPQALPSRARSEPALRRPPEQLWGRPHDPTSNHPKQVLERALGGPAHHRAQARIAESIDLATARQRCPHSLAPFLDTLVSAAQAARSCEDGEP